MQKGARSNCYLHFIWSVPALSWRAPEQPSVTPLPPPLVPPLPPSLVPPSPPLIRPFKKLSWPSVLTALTAVREIIIQLSTSAVTSEERAVVA